MGRSSRKGATSAEPREHWSETHPDRHLWTEAQRVHAEMQTQEEYEALYGRGPAVEPRIAVREPVPPEVLSDEDMLVAARLPYSGESDLHVGETLVNPLKNNREYRGVVRVRRDPREGTVYEGVTEYGASGRVGSHNKVVYRGKSIGDAVDAVNTMIAKKRQRDYESPPGTSGRVDSIVAREAMHEICQGGD